MVVARAAESKGVAAKGAAAKKGAKGVAASVVHFPGFFRDFDCFDSENQWDGKVVFVGF